MTPRSEAFPDHIWECGEHGTAKEAERAAIPLTRPDDCGLLFGRPQPT
ncbi:hypothetical protein ACFWWS_25725 [Streptomyces sp. NPDC059083]